MSHFRWDITRPFDRLNSWYVRCVAIAWSVAVNRNLTQKFRFVPQ
jgi:hypothetical protein